MRTGAAANHNGYFHEAVFYRSESELLDVAVPFLRGGIEAGEPTIVGFGVPHTKLIRDALPGLPIEFLSGGEMYARPASAIAAYRGLLADHVAAGAQQIRIIGELGPAYFGETWDWWARYESAINELYDEFPLWSMCAYDTMTTPAHVLDDIARTHPNVAEPAGRHTPSVAYVPPESFLTSPRPAALDPLQHNDPLIELTDASLNDARRAVEQANTTSELSRNSVDHVKLAVNEILTNALQHGNPPVVLRYWAAVGRMVVAVTNKGRAPADPFAGLRPAAHAPMGGLGLWLVHQLCDYVRLDSGPDDFTVTLTVGAPA
jgi:anti-sigma regulatory factor (Ser/Thr protein kinase)